jgi:hypothetical protein
LVLSKLTPHPSNVPDHQAPVKKISKDVYEITIDYVGSPGHELGWTPDGTK